MALKKTFIVLGVILLVFLALAGGAGVYLYQHPSTAKALLEKAGQSFLGKGFSIQELTYSLNPLTLHAENIRVLRENPQSPFSFKIKSVDAKFSLKGPFGRRTLFCNTLGIEGFSCEIYEVTPTQTTPGAPKTGSFWMTGFRKAISFLLFDEIKLVSARISNGNFIANLKNQTIAMSNLSADMHEDRLIDLESELKITWPAENMALKIPDFSVKTQNAISLDNPQLKCSCTFNEGELDSSKVLVETLAGKGTLDYDHEKQHLELDSLFVSLSRIKIPQLSSTKKDPLSMTLEASGQMQLQNKTALLNQVVLNVDRFVHANAQLKADFLQTPKVQINVRNARIWTSKALDLLPDILPDVPRPAWNVSGPVDVSGDLSGFRENGQWITACRLKALLNENAVHYQTPTLNLKGTINGAVTVDGPIFNPDFSGKCDLTPGGFMGMGISVPDFQCGLSFSGVGSRVDLKNLLVQIPLAETTGPHKRFSIKKIRLSSPAGRLNGGKKTLFFPEIRLDSSLIKNIELSVAIDKDTATLAAKGQHTGSISSARRLNLWPVDWPFVGEDALTLKARMDKPGQITFNGSYGLKGVSFNSPDQKHLGENISFKALISGHGNLHTQTFDFKTSLTAPQGELLMDRFYFDLHKTPFSMNLEGTFHKPDQRLNLKEFAMAFKDILAINGVGQLSNTNDAMAAELSLQIPPLPAKPVFCHLVQEPFKLEKPILAHMALEGNLSARLKLELNSRIRRAKGFFNWKDGSLMVQHPSLLLTGIDLSLPIDLDGSALSRSDEVLRGGLKIRNLRVPFLPEQSFSLPIYAKQNHFVMPSPLSIAVPGGNIRLGPTDLGLPVETALVIETSLKMSTLNLGPILSPLWPGTVTGNALGILSPIRIHDGRMTTEGDLKATVFKGNVELSNISVRGLFTPVPVLGLDARWQNLSLSQLTTNTAFGKIQGTLNGYAKNIEIANGQLQRFDLLMETDETDGVTQKISVKAVDNIARIGGGDSPFAGIAGLFISFFKEFPYRKIGVKASLVNDVFKINGTIHENGKEYLVKRGFFSGVDVINQSRDNRVGFKDMLKRIKRVTDVKSGPVIK